MHWHIHIYLHIFLITNSQNASQVLHNVIIFAFIGDVRLSVVVEFVIYVEDLIINKSAQDFLNRQNYFLSYKFIAHLLDLWKSGNIKYNYLQYELKYWQIFYLLRATFLLSSSEDLLVCGCSCKHSMRIIYSLCLPHTLLKKRSYQISIWIYTKSI